MKHFVGKLGSVLLAAAIMASFTACNSSSSGGSSGKKVTLTFWNNYTNDSQGIMAGAVKEWNTKHPDIQIVSSTSENNAYKTKIKTAISAGSAPDIIYSWAGGFTQPFVQAGKILALDNYLTDGIKDKLLSGALTNITYDGKIYGLPYNQQAGALYVNTDLFTKYGVEIPTTFDELLTAVKTFKSKGIVPMGVGEKDEWPGMWYYDMIALREAGTSKSLSALNKKASFNDPTFVAAAQKLLDLINAGAFAPDALSMSRDEAVSQFTQGNVPMYFGGNFDAQSIDQSLLGKVQAVKFPTIDGGQGNDAYLGGGADSLLVNADSKYKDQAVEAIKFLAPLYSSQMYLTGAGLPEWNYDDIDQSKIDPLSKQIMDSIVTGSAGSVPAWDLYLTGNDAQTHQDLVQQLFGKGITPQTFAQQTQQKINGNS